MSNMGRLDVFIEVAKQNSFSKAARILGITGPAASKQVLALEDELGVKLLNRTTRHVALTEEGAVYFERARLALDELKEAAVQIQELKAKPRGSLRVSAPLSFGHMHLLPILSGFAQKYPEIVMEVMLDDRRVDVVEEGFDVAIRIGVMGDSSLIGRALADCPLLLVASRAYGEKHGLPQTPGDLHMHRLIAYTLQGGAIEWRYKDNAGNSGVFRGEGIFKANTAELMTQAAVDGIGIALLPIFSITGPLQAGQLVHILPDLQIEPPRRIFALVPPNRYRAAKVRLFLDWLVAACKAMPWETKEGER
jgi:DNA-binding transcriptional LysR family regulator